jgi:hypothetical protein
MHKSPLLPQTLPTGKTNELVNCVICNDAQYSFRPAVVKEFGPPCKSRHLCHVLLDSMVEKTHLGAPTSRKAACDTPSREKLRCGEAKVKRNKVSFLGALGDPEFDLKNKKSVRRGHRCRYQSLSIDLYKGQNGQDRSELKALRFRL